MFLNIILLIVSLAMILFGAGWLTDGGSALAKRMGLSEMMIGLTIVAFGTSAPELVISVASAIEGNAGLAIGNVVGSNIANVLLIIGITAMVRPIHVGRSVLSNEMPLVILCSVALLACGNTGLLDGLPDAVTRVDGILLLLFFCIFLRYTFSQAKSAPADAVPEPDAGKKPVPMWRAVMLIVTGLAALVWGGDIFVDSASELASALGVSDAIIGLTVVALGTSLPELATSVVAAAKGHSDMAVGNVIGSCIFNILFVLGCSAVVRPLPLGGVTNFDLLTMTAAAVLFWASGWLIGHRVITRGEGALFTVLYIAYTVMLIIQA